MSEALTRARETLSEWESGDRYYPGSEDRLYSALHALVGEEADRSER